jgi:hypothetical protein
MNAVNVPPKRNKYKNLEEEKMFFVRRKEQDPWPNLSFFCLLLFEATFTSFFKDKKS